MSMKYPYWERRGWKYFKSSYSKKNTELVKQNNKKRNLQTKVIKGKRRLQGGKYKEDIILVKPKEKTDNLQDVKTRLSKNKFALSIPLSVSQSRDKRVLSYLKSKGCTVKKNKKGVVTDRNAYLPTPKEPKKQKRQVVRKARSNFADFKKLRKLYGVGR